MKKLAFIFQTAPYGNSSGREGLDTLIALSSAFSDIRLFFIDDGIFQLLPSQQPQKILMKHHSKMYAMLEYCDIEQIFICRASLQQFNINQEQLMINTISLTKEQITEQLTHCDVLFTF